MLARRHQTGHVRHVHHKQRARFPCGVREAPVVDDAAVGRCTGQDQLGAERPRHARHGVVVDEAVLVHIVKVHVVQLAGEIHRGAVGQVRAVGQAHGQDAVAGLQQGEIRRKVGGGAAVGLDVHMVVGVKDLLPPGDAVFLQLIHHGAAAVVPPLIAQRAPGRIALGILVGEAAAHGAEHIGADEVFAGDQLHGGLLALLLLRDVVEYSG